MPVKKKPRKSSSRRARGTRKFRDLQESIRKERKSKGFILETSARARLREELGEEKLNQIEAEILKLEQ